MTQRYGKIIQRNSFSESCPDDAEFVRRAQRSKTGPVVFYGDRDRVAEKEDSARQSWTVSVR